MKEAPRIEQNVRIIKFLRAKQIKYSIAYLKFCFRFNKANSKLSRPITSIFFAGSVHAKSVTHRLHKELVHISKLIQATEI